MHACARGPGERALPAPCSLPHTGSRLTTEGGGRRLLIHTEVPEGLGAVLPGAGRSRDPEASQRRGPGRGLTFPAARGTCVCSTPPGTRRPSPSAPPPRLGSRAPWSLQGEGPQVRGCDPESCTGHPQWHSGPPHTSPLGSGQQRPGRLCPRGGRPGLESRLATRWPRELRPVPGLPSTQLPPLGPRATGRPHPLLVEAGPWLHWGLSSFEREESSEPSPQRQPAPRRAVGERPTAS